MGRERGDVPKYLSAWSQLWNCLQTRSVWWRELAGTWRTSRSDGGPSQDPMPQPGPGSAHTSGFPFGTISAHDPVAACSWQCAQCDWAQGALAWYTSEYTCERKVRYASLWTCIYSSRCRVSPQSVSKVFSYAASRPPEQSLRGNTLTPWGEIWRPFTGKHFKCLSLGRTWKGLEDIFLGWILEAENLACDFCPRLGSSPSLGGMQRFPMDLGCVGCAQTPHRAPQAAGSSASHKLKGL